MADLKNNIAATHTLEEFISKRFEDQITFRNISILEVVDGNEWLDRNLITDYLPELKNISIDVQLSADQYRKYRYNPDLLIQKIWIHIRLNYLM